MGVNFGDTKSGREKKLADGMGKKKEGKKKKGKTIRITMFLIINLGTVRSGPFTKRGKKPFPYFIAVAN